MRAVSVVLTRRRSAEALLTTAYHIAQNTESVQPRRIVAASHVIPRKQLAQPASRRKRIVRLDSRVVNQLDLVATM